MKNTGASDPLTTRFRRTLRNVKTSHKGAGGQDMGVLLIEQVLQEAEAHIKRLRRAASPQSGSEGLEQWANLGIAFARLICGDGKTTPSGNANRYEGGGNGCISTSAPSKLNDAIRRQPLILGALGIALGAALSTQLPTRMDNVHRSD